MIPTKNKLYTLRKTRSEEDFLALVSTILGIKTGSLHLLLPLSREKSMELWQLAKASKLSFRTMVKLLDWMIADGVVNFVQVYPRKLHKENVVYISNEEVKGVVNALYDWYFKEVKK